MTNALFAAINALPNVRYVTLNKDPDGTVTHWSIQVDSDDAVDAAVLSLLIVGRIAELKIGPHMTRGKASVFGADEKRPDLVWRRAELAIDGVTIALYGPMRPVETTEQAVA